MLAKTSITSTLKNLDSMYSGASGVTEKELYSKLALLEVCGWVEEALDDIALNYSSLNITDRSNRDFLHSKVEDIYSFDYKSVKKILILLIGMKHVQEIEVNLNSDGTLAILQSKLNSLKKIRDTAAHTHTKGVMRSYDSPNLTNTNFIQIHGCLVKLEAELSAI